MDKKLFDKNEWVFNLRGQGASLRLSKRKNGPELRLYKNGGLVWCSQLDDTAVQSLSFLANSGGLISLSSKGNEVLLHQVSDGVQAIVRARDFRALSVHIKCTDNDFGFFMDAVEALNDLRLKVMLDKYKKSVKSSAKATLIATAGSKNRLDVEKRESGYSLRIVQDDIPFEALGSGYAPLDHRVTLTEDELVNVGVVAAGFGREGSRTTKTVLIDASSTVIFERLHDEGLLVTVYPEPEYDMASDRRVPQVPRVMFLGADKDALNEFGASLCKMPELVQDTWEEVTRVTPALGR